VNPETAAGLGNGDGPQANGAGPLVTGRIREPDGAAVGDAAVTLMDASGRQVSRATAWPDGSFQVRAPGPGPYTLIAMPAAHQPQASTVWVGSGAHGLVHHDVTVTASSRLTGTVTAAGTGEPVAGATVTLAGPRDEAPAAQNTDETGRYLFTDLVAGDYTLAVSAPTREATTLLVTIAGGGETVQDVQLAGHSSLAGTARTADCRPLPDARVALLDPDGNVATVTTTGPDGTYSFENLPPGDCTVVASGYPPVAQMVKIAPGQLHTHDPVLGHLEAR
jgi:hypothetical protein